MANRFVQLVRWLFASDPRQSPGHLAPRWIFLRAFGVICFSAFYALLFQAPGLIGPNGLLPAVYYLDAVKQGTGPGLMRFWYAPTLFWLGSSDHAVVVLAWIGIVASLLLVLNIWPRAMVAICLVAYVSFIGVLQAFSAYQSDGMLLGAAFLCLFFAPPGLRPGWGERHPPSRASLFLLQWLWFTIYFESGVVKILSGDPEWRNLTAMDDYYQNGPLPTWIAWHAQHLPHWFHVGTAGFTLVLELGLVWMLFLPRIFRIVLFWIVTPLQIGIILTSNYAFLNYEVLALGILLLDDKYLWLCLPKRLRLAARAGSPEQSHAGASSEPHEEKASSDAQPWVWVRGAWRAGGLFVSAICLSWVFYATAARLLLMVFPGFPLPQGPVVALQPFRIADSYGLFAVMTRGRYEIEFQGSNDGTNWVAYPFCYKPQDPTKAPRIYAPYQPRFDWNLWFASLDDWQGNRFVLNTEERLLEGSPEVLKLFCGDPFNGIPPHETRAILWQYWFSDRDEKRQGLWWRRMLIGLYAPAIQRADNGRFEILAMPEGRVLERRQ